MLTARGSNTDIFLCNTECKNVEQRFSMANRIVLCLERSKLIVWAEGNRKPPHWCCYCSAPGAGGRARHRVAEGVGSRADGRSLYILDLDAGPLDGAAEQPPPEPGQQVRRPLRAGPLRSRLQRNSDPSMDHGSHLHHHLHLHLHLTLYTLTYTKPRPAPCPNLVQTFSRCDLVEAAASFRCLLAAEIRGHGAFLPQVVLVPDQDGRHLPYRVNR